MAVFTNTEKKSKHFMLKESILVFSNGNCRISSEVSSRQLSHFQEKNISFQHDPKHILQNQEQVLLKHCTNRKLPQTCTSWHGIHHLWGVSSESNKMLRGKALQKSRQIQQSERGESCGELNNYSPCHLI